MVTPRQLATAATATTSVILLNWFYLLDTPVNYLLKQASIDFRLSATASANNLLKSDSRSARDDLGATKTGAIGTGGRIDYESNEQNGADDLNAPAGSRGTGSRGGCPDEVSPPVSLTLLVPEKQIGLTISDHPTFVWYLSDIPSVPVRFTLTDPEAAKTIIDQKIQNPKAGINRLEMPKNRPGLVPQRQYRWTVSLICNERRSSQNAIAQSMIKRVAAKPGLAQQLAAANSESDKAAIYASEKLWYNALATILAAKDANPKDASIRKDFLSLLDQVGLTEVTQQERK